MGPFLSHITGDIKFQVLLGEKILDGERNWSVKLPLKSSTRHLHVLKALDTERTPDRESPSNECGLVEELNER